MKLPRPKPRQFQSLITLFTMTIALMPMLVSAADDEAKKEKPKAPEIDIFQAAINGDTEAIKQHVAAGTNVNSKEPSLGSTPLGIASFFAHADAVKLLLENGADVNGRNNRGETPLDPASAEWGPQTEAAYKALAGALELDLDLERIKKERPNIAAILRKAGGKLSSDLKPEPPKNVFEAANRGDNESLKKFLEAGVDVNAKELSGGATPLLAAALFGQTHSVAWLIEKKADIKVTSKDGSTALHLAAFFAHPKTVELLLAKGAATDAENLEGETALDTVSGEWNTELEGSYRVLSLTLRTEFDLKKIKKDRPKVADILRNAAEKKPDQKK